MDWALLARNGVKGRKGELRQVRLGMNARGKWFENIVVWRWIKFESELLVGGRRPDGT